MTIHRKSAFAAAMLALTLSAAQADTPACSLGLMASLDMTVLPDGRVTVPVSLNGSEHPFLVSTGGVFSEVSDEVAGKLALPQTQTRAEIYGVSGKEHLASADVASLKIGGIEAKHFHLAVSKNDANPVAGVDGELAPDFLIQFDVELDFAKRKVNLFSQDHCPGKVVYWTRSAYAELPFRMTSGPATVNHHILFTANLDGHDLETLLDTSSPTTWLRHKPAVQHFGFDENAPDVKLAPTKRAGLSVYQKKFGVLHLGGVDAPNPTIDVLPDQYENSFRQEHSEKSRDDPIYGSTMPTEALVVGADVLSKLHVFIAYKEREIYVTTADAH